MKSPPKTKIWIRSIPVAKKNKSRTGQVDKVDLKLLCLIK